MVKKRRTVIGLGEGVLAKKAVDLALKHPSATITAVDRHFILHKKYLQRRGYAEVPRNLIVRDNTEAIDFLRRQQRASADVIYAHFVFQNASYKERMPAFQEIARVLKPGGRFKSVDSVAHGAEIVHELQRCGLRATIRALSPEDLIRLNTQYSHEKAAGELQVLAMERTLDQLSESERNELMQSYPANQRTVLGRRRARQELLRQRILAEGHESGDMHSAEGSAALKKISKDAFLVQPGNSFVLITATKGRIRYQ